MLFSLLYVGLHRLLGLAVSFRRNDSDKDIEIIVLRHQVRVLERQLHERVKYRPADRAILAALSRLLPRSRWRSSSSPQRRCCGGIGSWPGANGGAGGNSEVRDVRRSATELVDLIVRLGRENRRWGCVRIQGELRKLGIRLSASSIRRLLRRHGLGPVPRSRTHAGPSSCVPRRIACWPQTSSR